MSQLPITGRNEERSAIQDFQEDLSKVYCVHRLPRRLGDDYTILDQDLGVGCGGPVKLATCKDLKGANPRKFAVKAYNNWSSVPQDKRSRIESEVSVYLQLDFEHVTKLYDVYSAEDDLHLVMECMEGGELFDRVCALKNFPENTAADAVRQMLLATNYLHSKNIIHRDLKLDNFLYDKKDSNHLKLIDFGLSKVLDPNTPMQLACGSLPYMAPEIFDRSYSTKCDLWSLGVITFILLAGNMPFCAPKENQVVSRMKIQAGRYDWRPARWKQVSEQGQEFVKRLLEVNPAARLTAQQALQHTWIKDMNERVHVEADSALMDALRSFSQASKFRRCCLVMLASSLSNEERKEVHQYFISMDKKQQGTITLVELKSYLETRFNITDEEVREIFSALDSSSKEEVRYSDFLAAMVSTRIRLHNDMLSSAFRRFDADRSGYISKETMQGLIMQGGNVDEEEVERMMEEAHVDQTEDGKISYVDFVWYLRGNPDGRHAEKLLPVIDNELHKTSTSCPAALRSFGRKGSFQPRQGKAFATFSGKAEDKEVDISSLKIPPKPAADASSGHPAGATGVARAAAAVASGDGARRDVRGKGCGCGAGAALLFWRR